MQAGWVRLKLQTKPRNCGNLLYCRVPLPFKI